MKLQAPVSLASSLQDYLNDPNFEQNRIEYKKSKRATERKPKDRNGAPSAQVPKGIVSIHSYSRISFMFTQETPITSTNSTTTATSVKPPSPPPSGADSNPGIDHAATDIFSSIEEAQTPIFNPATGR